MTYTVIGTRPENPDGYGYMAAVTADSPEEAANEIRREGVHIIGVIEGAHVDVFPTEGDREPID